jgi:5'-methylthioadenosine phosphorylase
MVEPTIVIIGGTAAYAIDPSQMATVIEERVVTTPYGPSPRFRRLIAASGGSAWLASRHGEGQLERSARFVNYRANIWAARALGAAAILSWNGVGAIRPSLRVGDAVAPAAVMDWTRSRIHSFADFTLPAVVRAEAASQRAAARTIEHINAGADPRASAQPFAAPARAAILAAIAAAPGEANRSAVTYVCTEGPRLETPAEIELAAGLGADVVGMTLCPEVWLATELGLGYASLCLVTNMASGLRHLDPRRDFGPSIARRGLALLLDAAARLQGATP